MWIARTTCQKTTAVSTMGEKRTDPLRRRAHSRSERRLVLPEHVAHRAARLTHRAAILERLPQDRQQVVAPPRALADLLEAPLHEWEVAIGLESLQAVHLMTLGGGIDTQGVGHLRGVLDELVDPHDDVLLDPVALVIAERRLLDLVLHEVDRLHRTAKLVDLGHQLQRP